jgi:NADP-dependent 3-hydroxy acid dehydrogenase YdfG
MSDEQRTVLWITGAGSGMGRATAIRAAARGWSVALTGRREDALEETASLVRNAGGLALIAPADVRSTASLSAAHKEVRTWGQVGALVAGAGLNDPRRSWDDQSMTVFADIVQTNLIATAATIELALPDLRKSHGVVVVVSSYSAWRFSPIAGVAYSASKTALSAICETLNAQEATNGIRACHLCPGDVDSDFLELRTVVPDSAARRRMLAPRDVADAIQFVLDSPAHVRINELVITPR